MNRVTVTLPKVTYTQLKKLAKRDGVSVSQYVTYAIAKQVEQVETGETIKTAPVADEETPAAETETTQTADSVLHSVES